MTTLTMPSAKALGPGCSVRLKRLWIRLCCALFGHDVDNAVLSANTGEVKACLCGAVILREGGSETRISHNVSCFLFGHTYMRAGERDKHNEYVCFRCGHPLLFQVDRDPWTGNSEFTKKVRYLCNLFGHDVHHVGERAGFNEYACDCGHSFLRRNKRLSVVKHPPICLFLGHFVSYVERRYGWSEFVCRNCGHTFCFAVSH